LAMKVVVAIEGIDGSGKSSLARFVERLCQRFHRTCCRIGRRTGHTSGTIVKFTQLLNEEMSRLAPGAEVFLRLAREYQRAHVAAQVPQGIVILDRFVVSILTMARLHQLDDQALLPLLRRTAAQAGLHATLYIQCPFETAWDRVRQRHPGLSSTFRI